MGKKILIADDSTLIRALLRDLIETLDFDIDMAENGREAVDKALQTQYDVITMDINMPVLDGLSAVKEIMKNKPTPILMISSLTTESADVTIEALELGAVDYIPKPSTVGIGVRDSSNEILRKVELLSRIPKHRLRRGGTTPPLRERRPSPKEVVGDSRKIEKVLLIGASTGGPGLIERICSALPKDFPHPVCIVQHMPEAFTGSFAARLDRVSDLNVFEAANNLELRPGNVYVAKGGSHFHFSKKFSGETVLGVSSDQKKGPALPSVDEMYHSALSVFRGEQLMAVILTGIGDDGAEGMLAIKNAGGVTIGESEESATVYGMPKAAYERGGVMQQLPFAKIVDAITAFR